MFGSSGYAYIDKAKRSKFDKKSFHAYFVGYTENTESGLKKIEVTRSAKFDKESNAPYTV